MYKALLPKLGVEDVALLFRTRGSGLKCSGRIFFRPMHVVGEVATAPFHILCSPLLLNLSFDTV